MHITKKKLYFYPLSFFLLLIFCFLTILVINFKFLTFDWNVLFFVQRFIPKSLNFPFSVFSLIGTAEITGLIWIGICTYFLKKGRKAIFLGLLLFPLAVIIEIIMKHIIFHPAPPYQFYRGVIHIFTPSSIAVTSNSFPSGHMIRTTFLVVFLSVWALSLKNTKKSMILIGILGLILIIMSLSRIYLAEHWFSDVLGGIIIGTGAGLLAGMKLKND